jgi:hemerythrin superfamily protein
MRSKSSFLDSNRLTIVDDVLAKLEIHSNLEEHLIYPAIRSVAPDKNLIDDAIEEHHLMSLLARELRTLDLRDDRYKAKFRLLTRIVRQHNNNEETHVFPEAVRGNLDWRTLGQQAVNLNDR